MLTVHSTKKQKKKRKIIKIQYSTYTITQGKKRNNKKKRKTFREKKK